MVKTEYFKKFESKREVSFYRIPSVLFTDAYFSKVSAEAKCLYGILLDKMSLSESNGWIDREGRVYIYFPITQVMEYMSCRRDKAMKLLAELDSRTGIGLIERVGQGVGKCDRIYVKKFHLKEKKKEKKISEPEKQARPEAEMSTQETEMSTQETEMSTQETEMSTQETEMPTQETEMPTQKVGKSDCNQTEYNKTKYNINLSIDQSVDQKTDTKKTFHRPVRSVNNQAEIVDKSAAYGAYRDLIREQINYSGQVMLCTEDELEQVDGMVELMAEVMTASEGTVRISGRILPIQLVKQRLKQVKSAHIQYILDSLHRTTTQVRNVKAYLTACLFNAPVTIGTYYMPGLRCSA